MVVFVDLDSDSDELQDTQKVTIAITTVQKLRLDEERANALRRDDVPERVDDQQVTLRSGFSRAVGCYPIASSIAAHLDLNDLFALSLTCHRIHANLVQFSHQLVAHSLRCSNASQLLLSDVISRYNDSILIRDDNSYTAADGAYAGAPVALPGLLASLHPTSTPSTPTQFYQNTGHLLQSSKISHCARDLVAACRKCGTVVCRNCIAKPPSDRCLPDRFRRLCKACLSAPLCDHLRPLDKDDEVSSADSAPASSSSSVCSHRSTSVSENSASNHASDMPLSSLFTAPSFLRAPCTCATRGVHLCNACGSSLRASDTTYKRVWTWRSRYSTHIGGGLGTGLGEGDQGQKCARGKSCLSDVDGGGVCWVEIDCEDEPAHEHNGVNGNDIIIASSENDPVSALEGAQLPHVTYQSRSTTPSVHTSHNRPGYYSQEMEGIGGVVKKKVKKRVKVGATVWEFDDERETGRYLEREGTGRLRSWCGWCDRIVPGLEEQDEVDRFRLVL